jgi:hypothetical protein
MVTEIQEQESLLQIELIIMKLFFFWVEFFIREHFFKIFWFKEAIVYTR